MVEDEEKMKSFSSGGSRFWIPAFAGMAARREPTVFTGRIISLYLP